MASLQRKGLQARILTSEEKEKLKSDQALVSDFKQQKLEQEAQKNWDLFYKRNSINFFKNRHWTTREFEELKSSREFEGQKLTILEAGCGVGNCLFPLLEEDLNIFAYACDFSPRAVEYVKQNPLYDTERCKVFQCDLTKDDLLDNVPQESVDIVMLIFVLSAIHPDKMHLVLQNIYKVLKPGKSVLFRDYGLYDHTMLRFKGSRKLGENFYVRQDGTRSYFFTEEFLAQLFVGTGYEEVISEYVFRETVNKKEDLCVPRVFLQSKFRKPPQDLSPATLHHQVCGISLNTLHRVPTLGSLWLGVRRRREECEQKLGGRKTASAVASLKPEKVSQELKQSFRTPGEERLWKTLSLSFGKTLPHFHVEVAGAVSGVWPWR